MISQNPLYERTLTGVGMWSQVVNAGKTIRLTDLEGGANVGALFYNADNTTERYNMPDTLKGQHIFYLTSPFCIHSDMGRLFCSITADTCGWHDTVCGCSDAESIEAKYGVQTYQEARNDWYQNSRDSFLIELAKWGLGKRDIVPNINFFSKVTSDDSGALSWVAGNSKAGDSIDLRMEMRSIVVLNTCPHPLDEEEKYHPRSVKIEVFDSEPVADEDPSLTVRPENQRAFTNTSDYLKLRS